MDEFHKKYMAEMRAKVGIDDQQAAAVVRILDNTKQKFDDLTKKEKPLHDAIQQEQIDEVSALLTPQQKNAYDNWRAERARLHAEAQKKKEQQKQGK
jgi:ABC-type transporter Mla subunit MlaD